VDWTVVRQRGLALGPGAVLALALADAAVPALGTALLVYALRLRWPSRRLVLLPPIVAGMCAAVIAVFQVARALA